jgi:hypothetical protein
VTASGLTAAAARSVISGGIVAIVETVLLQGGFDFDGGEFALL